MGKGGAWGSKEGQADPNTKGTHSLFVVTQRAHNQLHEGKVKRMNDAVKMEKNVENLQRPHYDNSKPPCR